MLRSVWQAVSPLVSILASAARNPIADYVDFRARSFGCGRNINRLLALVYGGRIGAVGVQVAVRLAEHCAAIRVAVAEENQHIAGIRSGIGSEILL